ncbi:MAG: patatin-like phospholipase family protein [Bdellovibrionota bacterium]
MISRAIIFALIIFSVSTSVAKQFGRALVLSGGGADWAMFTGMYQELKNKNLDSDLIVGVCGGSFAAAMVYAKPDADFSNPESVKEFFEFSKKVKMNKRFVTSYANFALSYKQWIKKDQVPPFVEPTVLALPNLNEIPSFNQKFAINKGKRLIILATRMLFDPFELEAKLIKARKEALRNDQRPPPLPFRDGRKLYRLTLFTDPETAKVLRALKLKSKPAMQFPDSAMEEDVEVVDNASIGDAVRASISDPLLLQPASVNGNFYMTGATDNYPAEMISQVAGEVIHSFSGPLPGWQNDIFKAAFHYDTNEMINRTKRELVSRWVFLGDRSKELRKNSMNPGIKHYVTVAANFPKTEADFNRMYLEYYKFGAQRTIESFKYEPFSIDPLTTYVTETKK